MIRDRFVFAFSLVAFFLPHFCWASGPPSLNDVLEGLYKIEQSVFETKSFYVKYERDEVVNLLNPESRGLLTAQWTQAFCGDKWYSERRFTKPGIFEGSKRTRMEVPAEPSILVLKHGIVIEWDKSSQPVTIDKIGKNGNLYSGLNYTRNLSLDAPRYIAKAGKIELADMRAANPDNTDLPFLPAFCASNRTMYTVLDQQEKINGVQCWILDWPGMDRIAVDANRGFAIIRRTYTWAPGKPLRVEITNSDHREVKRGLWLPFEQQETRFASIAAEPEANWGKPATRARYKVHAMRIDDVDEALFELKLPPQTRVFDGVRDFHYQVAENNSEPFAQAIAAVAEQQQVVNGGRFRWLWIGVSMLAAIIVIVTVAVYRQMGAARSS